MPHSHIAQITQIPNLEIECKTLYRVQNRRNCGQYIGSMPIYRRFWMKNAISVWICQIIAARCHKRNIGAISGLYRGYLEHCVAYSLFRIALVRACRDLEHEWTPQSSSENNQVDHSCGDEVDSTRHRITLMEWLRQLCDASSFETAHHL